MKRKTIKNIFYVLLPALMPAITAAQEGSTDGLQAFREVAKIREIFNHLPVQLNINIHTKAEPIINSNDSTESKINLYYDKSSFYLQAEGLEEIANDSFIIMVNKHAKQILLYLNNQQIMQKMQSGFSTILPDSSLQYLAKTYTSTVENLDGSRKKIILKSKENIYGTNLSKEIFTLVFRPSTYEDAEFNQTKFSLIPVDSAVYASFNLDKQYEGRLVKRSSKKGEVYFLAKKQETTYKFTNISYAVQSPPVKPGDRVQKSENGSFIPAKGYEEYILSKEF